MSVRAAIFDLDDTLYLERDYVRSGYWAVAEFLRTRQGREDRFEDWLWARFLRGQAGGAFDELNAQFALGLSKADIVKLVEVYREHQPTIRPMPGIVDLLSVLRPQYAFGLLADGFLPAQRLKLAALGLERFFDAIVFTEELGRHAWKPSPAGFELMQQKILTSRDDSTELVEVHEGAGGEPLNRDRPRLNSVCPLTDVRGSSDFAYISDNPAKDFVAPNRLGWRTIQLLYPGQVHARNAAPEGGQPQFTARLPGEVAAILRQ